MAGKHRGLPAPEVNRVLRMPTTSRVMKIVELLADAEQRSVGNMVNVLVCEALSARGLLTPTPAQRALSRYTIPNPVVKPDPGHTP